MKQVSLCMFDPIQTVASFPTHFTGAGPQDVLRQTGQTRVGLNKGTVDSYQFCKPQCNGTKLYKTILISNIMHTVTICLAGYISLYAMQGYHHTP